MSGRRAAAIALSLVMDLADRLDAAGVPAEKAPSLDEGMDAIWPLAKRLAKIEKTAGEAADSAARARNATLDCAVARFAAAAGVGQPDPAERRHPARRWRTFDASHWHVALVPATPAADRERDREVA